MLPGEGLRLRYVSALVYGEGEYATGEETTGNASVDVLTIGGASAARACTCSTGER